MGVEGSVLVERVNEVSLDFKCILLRKKKSQFTLLGWGIPLGEHKRLFDE